jgi:hypothetical protein
LVTVPLTIAVPPAAVSTSPPEAIDSTPNSMPPEAMISVPPARITVALAAPSAATSSVRPLLTTWPLRT